MLANLGITVEQDGTDFNAMLDAATAGTFTINTHGISFDNYDAFGSVLAFWSDKIPTEKNGMQGQNNYRYSSADMDKWLNAAQNATTVTALKEAYSHVQDILPRTFHACILSSAFTPTKSARDSRATTTCPPPSTTTGTFSTGIGGSKQDDQVCRHHSCGVRGPVD